MKQLKGLISLVVTAVILRYLFLPALEQSENKTFIIVLGLTILGVGAIMVLTKAANVIEETTEILSERTKLAGGLLQSLGTAFPDMILGIIAAILSVQYRNTDVTRSINYAIIASATTFGSNIYNIGHAAWCIFRQNMADAAGKLTLMFPFIKTGGVLKPLSQHPVLPQSQEIETASSLLTILTVITSLVAMSMVIFGRVPQSLNPTDGDLYQLIIPVGWLIFIAAIATLISFRKSMRDPKRHSAEVIVEERFYATKPTYISLLALFASGIGILFAAESMVRAIETLCDATSIPFVVAGVLAGIIGCLGEMLVVHNFSISPKGRIGDAIVGVAMDNIVTIMGAAIVSIMGGIFLGGNALILIFVLILCLNMILLWQISLLHKTILVIPKK